MRGHPAQVRRPALRAAAHGPHGGAADVLGPLLRQVLEGVDGAGWRGGGTAASAAPSSFPFYFVVSCMFVAFLYYPLVFVPVWSRSNPGYLWDKTSLHVFSLLTQLVMWTSFYLVWKKDPGVVGRNENAPELGGGGGRHLHEGGS